MSDTLQEMLQEALNPNEPIGLVLESRKKDAKVLLDGAEVDFGCPEHCDDMEKVLAGLERLRNGFAIGSGARLTFAHAHTRLKKLLATFKAANGQV